MIELLCFLGGLITGCILAPRFIRWLESLDDDELRRCRFKRRRDHD